MLNLDTLFKVKMNCKKYRQYFLNRSCDYEHINLTDMDSIDVLGGHSYKHTNKFIMWVFNIYLDSKFKISRNDLVKFLSSNLIDTRNAFVPINYQKCIIEKCPLNIFSST